jgi:hypothetical protein
MNFHHPGFFHRHGLALFIFTLLATLFLWEVLLLDYSLGAFDIILNQPSWKGEFSLGGIHQPILSDSPTAHYPQREFNWGHARQFSNAELNPYIFTGMPWSPQGVGAFLTSFPQLVLDVKGAIDWSTWFRLICAGFFMYLLIIELGLSRMAGIFAGILWTYSLHQVVWLEFPQHLATQLWIPLLFLFNLRIFRCGLTAELAVALLVINILFFTSGYMQIVLYTYIAVGLFNTLYVLAHADRGNMPRQLRRWAAVHAVYIAAVVICAVGLIAEAQYISQGLRGAQDWRGRVSTPELNVESLIVFFRDIFPRVSEVTHVLAPDYHGGFWRGRYQYEHGNVVETARYFGIFGVLFAIAALPAVWRTAHVRLVVVFVVVTGLVFSLFYRNEFSITALRLIPFADKGSYSRFITLLTFFGCILAAYGLQHSLGTRRYRWLLVAIAAVCGYVLAASLSMEDLKIARLWYPAAAAAGLCAVVAARHMLRIDWSVVGWLVVAATAADLFAAGYGFNTRMENERLFPRNNTIKYLLNDPEPYRVAVISDRPLYHPNILSYYDIPVVEGYLTVLPVAYAGYIKGLFPKMHVTRNGILFILEPNVEALRLLNVKYVLSDAIAPGEHPGLEHIIDSNNHGIYRVRNHLPRVFCASDVFYRPGSDDHVKEYKKRLGEFSEPLVLTGEEARVSYSGDCRIRDLEVFTHGLTATVETEQARFLVVPYPFNDNWHVTINGEPGRLLEANGYHMAVEVPAGASAIELQYRNPWNRLAALVLILVFSSVLVFAWRSARVPGVLRLALTAAALAVVFKSSLSLPLVRNDRIPEREPLAEQFEVIQQGAGRTEWEQISERVHRDNPVTLPLGIESKGLVSLSLMAGTFHQPRLEQTVTVEILDAAGNVLVERRVEGGKVGNNSWFTVRFPPIEQDTLLSVRVSTDEARMNRSFVLWLDGEGEVCVQSFYRWDS